MFWMEPAVTTTPAEEERPTVDTPPLKVEVLVFVTMRLLAVVVPTERVPEMLEAPLSPAMVVVAVPPTYSLSKTDCLVEEA